MDSPVWRTATELARWIDGASPLAPETGRLLQLMKLSEEVGEVSQAVIGVTGQNPRKGVTHTWDDVAAEVCDVILTAMVTLASLTPNPEERFSDHLSQVARRCLGDELHEDI
jgi:NTP pyrophosphatase (non-canonical NTP hydrolase)